MASYLSCSRSQNGFSLTVVLIIGMIGTLLSAAMFGVIMPVFTSTSNARTRTALRAAAESGLDWAVGQYNIDGGQSAGLETGVTYTVPQAGPTVTVPANIVNKSGSDNFIPTVTVSVNIVQPPSTSAIFDPTVNYPTPAGVQPPTPGIEWRTLTATATSPTGQSQQLQVAIHPYNPQPFQINGIKAQTFAPAGKITTGAKNSNTGITTYQGNIDVNQILALPNNTQIQGSVTVRAQPGGNTTTPYLTGFAGTQISGIASSNGLISGINSSQVSGYTYDSSGNQSQVAPPNNYLQSQNLPMWNMPPMPPIPPATYLTPSPCPITNSQTLGVSGSTTTTNYYIGTGGTEVSLSGTKALTISSPVALYLGGNTNASTTVMSFTGQSAINVTSGHPADFVIYYNGKGTLDLHGLSAFTGVIIAPNANVIFGGNAQIYGAVLANNVTSQGGGNSGGFTYDPALNSAFLFPPSYSYKVATWRELL